MLSAIVVTPNGAKTVAASSNEVVSLFLFLPEEQSIQPTFPCLLLNAVFKKLICDFTHTSIPVVRLFSRFKEHVRRIHDRIAHYRLILATSAGLFGAYVLGFYDGVKEGERMRASFVTPHVVSNISHLRSISNG